MSSAELNQTSPAIAISSAWKASLQTELGETSLRWKPKVAQHESLSKGSASLEAVYIYKPPPTISPLWIASGFAEA